ncbi:MAG TPA: glutathione S-transferase family protein [Candidatus Limnocylindrales bacterium]|nr:glutathione S-transferase family protein [Candidatus Limnocylindrales bacterium]
MIKLYSGPLSMFGAKAEIAFKEKGVPCDREFVPFSLATFYEPKHPEVARINAKKQVPVLIDGDLELFDSTQIFEYLEDIQPSPPLWPSDKRERARARLLELKSDEVFFPNVILLMPHLRGNASDDVVNGAIAAIQDYYAQMDARLERGDYLAGAFTYADIAFYMAQFFAGFLGQPPGEEHARLLAWKSRMAARPAVAAVVDPMRAFLAEYGVAAP